MPFIPTMENDQSPIKALDTACRFLAARPHTKAEIRRKLSRKGYSAETITAILSQLQDRGYLNEEETALRWGEALVRDKLWGPLKITAYLMQKGIAREIIDRVQRQIWQEFDESVTAGRALRKRFGSGEEAPEKKMAFLRSRGFSPEVIYKIIREPVSEQW